MFFCLAFFLNLELMIYLFFFVSFTFDLLYVTKNGKN